MTDMTLERFRSLAEAWGGDLSRWPADQQVAAQGFLETSPDARACLEEEMALDGLIREAAQESAPASLRVRVSGIPDEAPRLRQILPALWPFGPVWRPVAGLAAAACFGVGVGLIVPPAGDGTLSSDPKLLALSGDLYAATAFEAFGFTEAALDNALGSID